MNCLKKTAILFIIISSAFLTGCAALDVFPPKEVVIGDKHYRTGFYGDLYPHDLSFTGEEYQSGSNLCYQLDTEHFDLIQTSKGTKSGGTIYCLDSQWEEAKAYYENGENYIFYCQIHTSGENITKVIDNMDFEQFEALILFSGKNEYIPFSPKELEGQQTIDFPDESETPRLKFYKDSIDGLFTSLKYHYYVVDGKMYLVRYYDHGDDKVHVMEIPEEIAEYFVPLSELIINAD